MNTFCDYHYLICRNLAYQPSGKMRRFISMLLILRHSYCFSSPCVAAPDPARFGAERSLLFFFFLENGGITSSPSDIGRISPVIDKPADVRIVSELINQHMF